MKVINLHKEFNIDIKTITQHKFTSMEIKYDVTCELSSYLYDKLNNDLYREVQQLSDEVWI